MKSGFVIGIDEVGRGALAGPVVVAAALVPRGLRLRDLKDSKKLSAKQREEWFGYCKNNSRICFAVARVYPRGIERMNVSAAANLAAERAYRRLLKNAAPGLRRARLAKVFLDGGLFIGNGLQPKHAKTIVRGDEKIKAVAVASVVAKVSRDAFMKKLAKKHPGYRFDLHKGYGTKVHLAAILKNGPCEAHRLTFLS